MKDFIRSKGKIGKKGEIYIPKKIRELMGLMPGDKIEVDADGEKLIIKREPTALDLLKENSVYTIKVEEMWDIRKDLSKKLSE